MAAKTKTREYEVVNLDFDDPHWRRDLDMERLLTSEGLNFEYIKAPSTKFTQYFERSEVAGQEQVRSTGSTASIVQSYKEALLLGERLPSGTVNVELAPIDFYHRGKGAIEAGIDYFILIRVTDEVAPWQRGILATLRNNLHGLRMTDVDTMKYALTAVEHGWSAEETARKFRIDVSTLRRAMAVRQTEARALKLGVEAKFAALKRTTQGELATIGLHDGPFKALVTLLSEFPLSTAKANEFIRDVKGQPSDRAGIDRVKEIRATLIPPTLPTLGGSDTTTTTTQTTTTTKGAAKALLDAISPLKAVFADQPTMATLLQASPSDSAYPRIKKALEEMREPFEKLVAHYA